MNYGYEVKSENIQPCSTTRQAGKGCTRRKGRRERAPTFCRQTRGSILIGLRRCEKPGILTVPPRVCSVPERTSAQAAAGEHERQGNHRQQKNRLGMLPLHPWWLGDTWKETLLVGRFASRTSAGVLFSSNVAALGTKSNRSANERPVRSL